MLIGVTSWAATELQSCKKGDCNMLGIYSTLVCYCVEVQEAGSQPSVLEEGMETKIAVGTEKEFPPPASRLVGPIPSGKPPT